MLQRILVGASFALTFATAQTSYGVSGAQASMDISVVEQAKNVYFDEILKLLNNLKIPDINSDDGKDYLHGNHISVQQDPNNVVFTVDQANNAIVLTANKLSAQFFCDSFREHSFLFVTAKGHLEVKMDTVNIGVGLQFTTQTLPDGRIVPAINSVDVLVDIDRNDIDIKIWGNIWADFAAAFEIFFKSTVVQLIQDSVRTALTDGIPYYANQHFAASDGLFAVPTFDEWFLDWQTKQAAIVTEDSIEVGILGIMFDQAIGEAEFSTNFPADLPYHDDSQPAGFQAFVSDQSIDSIMGSYLEIGKLGGWYNYTMVPANATYVQNTGELDQLLPGIAAKYGPDAWVNLHFDVTRLQQFTSSAEGTIGVNGDVDVKIYVETGADVWELAADLNLVDVDFVGALIVSSDFTAYFTINRLNANKVEQLFSSFGDLNMLKVKLEVNNLVRYFLPSLDAWLKTNYTVPIPTSYSVFELQDLALQYHDGYLAGMATPIFKAPTQSAARDTIFGQKIVQSTTPMPITVASFNMEHAPEMLIQ